MKKFWIQLTAAAAALVLLFGYNFAILAKEEAEEEIRTDSADTGTENADSAQAESGEAESEEAETDAADSTDVQSAEADAGGENGSAGEESGNLEAADAETDSESAGTAAYADGTYQGTGEGYGGEITVEVTVEGGSIESVTVISAKEEDAAYFNTAKGIIEDILEKQSADVDTVSGATYSSAGIRDAVSAALEEAEL